VNTIERDWSSVYFCGTFLRVSLGGGVGERGEGLGFCCLVSGSDFWLGFDIESTRFRLSGVP
jgi:hypothetical protein